MSPASCPFCRRPRTRVFEHPQDPVTLRDAAIILRVPRHVLQFAAEMGAFPLHPGPDGEALVLIHEILRGFDPSPWSRA
jgi:hypothetical protein